MIRLSSQSVALIQLSLDTFVKSAIILSAAGLLTASLRRASAASRHLVWSVAIVSLLALPILSVALPSWQIPAPPSVATVTSPSSFDGAAPELASSGANEGALGFERSPDPAAPALDPRRTFDIGSELPASSPVSLRFDITPNPVTHPWNRFDWKVALLLAWLIGALVVMARLTMGTARVWLLTRQAQRVTESSWIMLARTLG